MMMMMMMMMNLTLICVFPGLVQLLLDVVQPLIGLGELSLDKIRGLHTRLLHWPHLKKFATSQDEKKNSSQQALFKEFSLSLHFLGGGSDLIRAKKKNTPEKTE